MRAEGLSDEMSRKAATSLAADIDIRIRKAERATAEVKAIEGTVILTKMELGGIYERLTIECRGEDEFYPTAGEGPVDRRLDRLGRTEAIAEAESWLFGSGVRGPEAQF